MMVRNRRNIRWWRWLTALLLASAVVYFWKRTVRLSSENNLTVLDARLRDHIGIVVEYELDVLELAREAGPDALPLLQRALRAQDSPGYERVYDRLQGWLGARSLTKGLRQFLPPPDRDAERTRAGAARMLEAIGEDAAPASKSLLSALDDDSELVRLHASLALLRLGGFEGEVLAGQQRWLPKQGSRNPTAATYVLAQLGPPAKTALPLLLPLMNTHTNTEEMFGRLCLPWILAQKPLHPPAQSFSELFRRTPRNPDDADAWRLVDSAREFLEADLVHSIESQNDDDGAVLKVPEIRSEDTLGIVLLGSLSSNLLQTLKVQLSSPDSSKRFAAGFAWWHVTGDALGSAEAMGSTDSPDDDVAKLAFLLTMCDLGKSAAPAARKTAGFLTNSEALHRRLAARSLGRVGESGLFAVPDLVRCLDAECRGLRLDAAETLWNLKGETHLLLPALTALLDDRSPRRRGQASRLLQLMGPTHVPPEVLKRAQAVKTVEPDAFPSVFQLLTRMLGQSGSW